ncbi:MAG: thioredoxin domain-containing protein, partial [Planctomycetota bacterium]
MAQQDPGGPAHTNRLVDETSPYLLQHAHNPVDWWPWGDAAFAAAAAAGKPVFLSIGYSTCHWCHVMERESFENERVAAFLNKHFICIKVDREERPDVDAVYMAVTQRMTGHGGWPMSVWLTPDRRPFYAGTYFPPDSRFGRPGFVDVCAKLAELWSTKREAIDEDADRIVEAVFGEIARAGADTALDRGPLASVAAVLTRVHDREWGGFGGPPKFPTPHNLVLLLQLYAGNGDPDLLRAAEHTLDRMAAGGIRDHVGGGFARYSTDREWLVPHFEKMLYDQAGLLRAYLAAHQVTGHARHAAVARDIVRYLFRDLRDDAGPFHSAEDADSEGEEGKFYVWTIAELRAHLGAERGDRFGRIYGCRAEGNWAEESTRHRNGTNILHLPAAIADAAKAESLDAAELAAQLQADRDTLLAVRAKRIRPLLDDKILTAWNGLAIGALAYGGRALDEPAWTAAAAEAADYLLAKHRRDDGRLLRSSRHGTVKPTLGYLDDYAFLADACLELYTTTGDVRWLTEARTLCTALLDLFGPGGAGSTQRGLLYFTGHDAEALITRSVEVYDGAMPSGNSVAARVLLRLGRLLFDQELENAGAAILREAAERLNDNA